MSTVTVDKVIDAVVALRDKRSALAAKYKEKDGALKEKLEKLNTWLLAKMQEDGASQLGSEAGTAYVQTKMKASAADWESVWGYVQETGRFDVLEKRLSAKTIQAIHEEEGVLVPGVNIFQEQSVTVRRK